MKNKPFENLKELTDSIKAGERVVLLPPGLFSLIATIIFLIVASVTLVGGGISSFAENNDPSFKAAIQFGSMGVIFIFVILPALMIFQGKKKFSLWMFYYAIILVSLSALFIIANFTSSLYFNTPILISLVSSLISMMLVKSSSFSLLKEFFYLLKSNE